MGYFLSVSCGILMFICILLFGVQGCSSMGQNKVIGTGKYNGEIIEIRHHGIFWMTDGFSIKTGENASHFENFCVIDKDLFSKLKTIKDGQRVSVHYESRLSTPSWACDLSDGNDIAISIQIL